MGLWTLNGSQTLDNSPLAGKDHPELPVLQKIKQDLKNDLIAGLLVVISPGNYDLADLYHCQLGNSVSDTLSEAAHPL